MNIKQLRELLNIYGCDFSRWPPERVKPAREFIKNHPEAQELLKESGAIDTLFNANSGETAPKGLLDKIMNKIDSDKE